jgi:very-short-patch-repair endonuclease
VSAGFVRVVEAAVEKRAPTLTLPRKREREWTAFGAKAIDCKKSATISVSSACKDIRSPSTRRGEPPLPLAGEGWGGGSAASEISTAEQKSPTWKVSSKLRSNARALRKNSTDAERILWSELRDHRLNGASFRRQVPIENYIADFMCHAARLVIELDGGQHFSDDQEHGDAVRSAAIEGKGYRVIRFSNHDVMTNRTGVLETIATAIEASAPTLTLPRKRERGSAADGAIRATKLGAKQKHDARLVEPAQPAPSPACGGGLGWGPATARPLPSDESSES